MALKVFGNKKVVLSIFAAIIVGIIAAITIFIVDAAMNGFETSGTQKVTAAVLMACMVAIVALPFLIYGARRQLETDN